MPIVKLPDGTLVQLPDSPEEGPSLLKELGAQAKKVGVSLAAGAGEMVGGVLRAPGAISDFLTKNKPKDGGLVDRAFSKDRLNIGMGRLGRETGDFWENLDKSQGMEQGLPKTFVKGVGGSLVTPILGAGTTKPLQTAAVNLFSGGTGAVGADLAAKWAPEGFKGPAAVLGGIVGGGLPAFAFGPKQTVAEADIRRELEGVPDQAWADASANIDLFNATGARTATLAEAFPGKTRIAALAGRAANSKGGERLGHQLEQRDADLQGLGDTFLNRIGPEVDANQVANTTTGAADNIMKRAKQMRGQSIGATFAGQSVKPDDTLDIYLELQKLAGLEKRPEARQAYGLVAEKLFDADGRLLVGVQDLSFALKGLKKATKNPNSPVFKGSDIENRDLINAINVADRMLRQRSAAYKTGMEDFEQTTRQVIEPLRKGPIGSLAAKNPTLEGQAPFGRLGGLLPNNSPSTISQTVTDLADPVKTLGAPQNSQELARALMQQKLGKGSTNPGNTIRGAQGTLADRQTEALLSAAGLNAADTTAPLRAADQMQGLSSAGASSGFPEMRSSQALIRPFRTVDMMMTARTERETQAAIAEYVARPTQAGLSRLREMAMFNPNIRRQLTLLAALRPGMAADTSQEQ